MKIKKGILKLRLPFFLCGMALLLLPCKVFSQYDEYRYPQDKDEIAKFRKMKVRIEDKYPDNDTARSAHTIREFDTLGRIITSIGPYNHKHYEYDAKGRLITYIDSALGAGEYIRSNYEFEYEGPDGRLSFARVDPFSLTFKYDAEKKFLFESTMIDFEQYRQRYFYYDSKGILKEEQWFYPKHNKEKSRILSLNRNGKPFQEVVIKYYLNGGLDSEFVTYRYDDKNRELEKKTISTTISHPEGYDTLPMKPLREVDTSKYTYTYNNYGRSSETFHYSLSGYDHKFEWWYDTNGLKHEENYFRESKNVKHSLYKYTFYTPSKPIPVGKKKK